MITPTGATVAEYWDAIKGGNPQHVRLTFNNGATLDDSDVEVSGIEISDILNGDTSLSFGRAVAKEFTAKFFDSSNLRTFSWGSEFTLEFGVEINGTTNWVTVGIFSGNKPENYPVNGVVEFHAYDRMRMFDIPADGYLNSITYPTTFANIYHGLCGYVGLQYENGDELANIMSRSFPASPIGNSDLACRDVLGLLAEACGCYARINSSGKVQMVWFSDQTGTEIDADYEFNLSALNIGSAMIWNVADTYTWNAFEGFTWDDLDGYKRAFHFDALNVRSSDNDIGVTVPEFGTGYTYYIIDNPFLYTDNDSDVEDYIQPIYDRLDAFAGYLPMTVECVGNWLIESGDIITVDFHGESVEMPIFVQTIRWTGAVRSTYEATGTLDKDYLPSSTHEKLTQMGRLHEIKQTIEGNYELIQDEFGNYYTKTETAQYVTTTMSSALGNYYTKTETASYVNTQMTDALGNYYTKTETATQISTYVGNNAYGKVSGITITANGIDLTGSQYIKLTSGNTYMKLSPSGIDFTGTVAHFTTPAGYVCGINGFNFSRTTVSSHYVYHASAYDVNGTTDLLDLTASTNGIIIDSNGSFVLYPSNQSTYGIAIVKDGNYCRISGQSAVKLGDPSLGKINLTYAETIYYTTLIQSSSRDIKHDIQPLDDVGEKVDALNPVTFVYDDDANEQRRMGMIYEDTVEVMPEICTGDESEKAINYVELIPVLLKEIQSLRARVRALEG